MSLESLCTMNFPELTEEEASNTFGGGDAGLSRAQCEWIFAQTYNPWSCSYGDYYKLWKDAGCNKKR